MHLNEDDLILHYYGELEPAAAGRIADHLRECAACNASFTTLQRVLAAVNAAPPLELGDGFERKVWARLQPELDRGSRNGWLSWFVLSPARLAWVSGIVMLVAAAFFAGRVSRPTVPSNTDVTTTASSTLRERILLSDLGEHLDRSQFMLTELVSADPSDTADFAAQRARAQELVADNRLYRQTATANGNAALAAGTRRSRAGAGRRRGKPGQRVGGGFRRCAATDREQRIALESARAVAGSSEAAENADTVSSGPELVGPRKNTDKHGT